jgi:L-ornithine N5-monooxygenase
MSRSHEPRRHRWVEPQQPPAYDLVGIGFGPSNLALAIAVQEEAEGVYGRKLRTLFVEKRERFWWHPGLLLGGARVQLNFLKDLVTLRNPCSRFSFLSFVREEGRLDEFVNLRNFFPTRLEFNKYYQWAADKLRDQVRHGAEVVGVTPGVGDAGAVEFVEVEVRDQLSGETEVYRARNLVVATGGLPSVPGGVDIRASQRAFHSQEFLPRMRAGFPDHDRDYRFVVVGSGQTAAEVFEYLYTHYPNADVTAAIRRFAYKPADDSHFVNEIFFPRMVDRLYAMPAERRADVLGTHMDTNYSCVDLDLIQTIYEELYQRKVAGDTRIRIQSFLELRSLVDHEARTVLQFHDVAADRPVLLEADGVILATGYQRPKRHPLLETLAPYFIADAAGDGFAIDRKFRIQAREDFLPNVFLQGFCQDTHGLSDTLLSTLPLRALEILQSLTLDEDAVAALGERAL